MSELSKEDIVFRKEIKDFVENLGLDEINHPRYSSKTREKWDEYLNKSNARRQLEKLPKAVQKEQEIRSFIKKVNKDEDILEKELEELLKEHILDKIAWHYFSYLLILEEEKQSSEE